MVMSTLKAKLMPTRFDGMSPLMAAIVGYVIGEAYTTPEIAEMTVGESDNLVYIRKAGAIGFVGIQSLEDLRDNWNRLLDAAGLTPEERKEAVALFYSRVETLPGVVTIFPCSDQIVIDQFNPELSRLPIADRRKISDPPSPRYHPIPPGSCACFLTGLAPDEHRFPLQPEVVLPAKASP